MGGSQNGAAGPGESVNAEPLNAPLFRSLVERLEEGERAVILDLGPAQPATVSLFSNFRCRLEIADIAEGLSSLDEEDETPEALRNKAESLLPERRDEPTDLVLCWDLLNYLNPPALKALMTCVAERGRPGMKAHALIAYSASRMPATPNRYAPTKDYRLKVLPTTSREIDSPRYTPETLGQRLPHYRRERAMLLRNGMQEYLFVV
jgi:predicted TPR repeat methyltransferase